MNNFEDLNKRFLNLNVIFNIVSVIHSQASSYQLYF